MNIWTFFCIIIIIGVTGDALKKAFQGSQTKKSSDADMQKIRELTRRVNELESRTDTKEIERRLQALESIVVDGDYILDKKFKKAFGEEDKRSREHA